LEKKMRRRRLTFLPVFLIALAVQILVPIAASWGAAIAAADPLRAAEICLTDSTGLSGGTDQGADHRAHDGLCSICCAAQAAASFDVPQLVAVTVPVRQHARMVWRESASDIVAARTGSNAQARGPPRLM